jgi:hypothetical protein
MTTLHEPRHVRPGGAPPSVAVTVLAILGVIAVVGFLVVTVVLLSRGGEGHGLMGSRMVRGSGMASSETRTTAPFTAVELEGSNDVVVRVGAPQSIVVHADDNLLDHVTTAVRSGALVIGNSGDFSTRSPMWVSVVVPELTRVTLSGSGRVTIDGVDAPTFRATLPGSGSLQASGRAEQLDASLKGSGELNLQGLVAVVADVRLEGSGQVQVHATQRLDAVVSGTGAIIYTGNPRSVTRMVTGTGSIEAG